MDCACQLLEIWKQLEKFMNWWWLQNGEWPWNRCRSKCLSTIV